MKRFIAILLTIVISLTTSGLDQVVKLPFLFIHFQENKLSHPNDTIERFLYNHYVLNQKAESENDKKSDARLPFKSLQHFNFTSGFWVLTTTESTTLQDYHLLTFSPYKELRALNTFFDIWQPPQLS